MVKIRNKKAWIRILEAFIAITLITGVLITLYTKTSERVGRGEEIYKLQETILEEIASNQKLRGEVLRNLSLENITSFIAIRVPSGFNFTAKVCDVGEICELPEYRKEGRDVYSTPRIISSTLETYKPKQLKIFMWPE